MKLILMPPQIKENNLLELSYKFKLPIGFWNELYVLESSFSLIELLDLIYDLNKKNFIKLKSKLRAVDEIKLMLKVKYKYWKRIKESALKYRRNKGIREEQIIETLTFTNSLDIYSAPYREYGDVVIYLSSREREEYKPMLLLANEVVNFKKGSLIFFDYFYFISLYKYGHLDFIIKVLPEDKVKLFEFIVKQIDMKPEEVFKLYLDDERIQRKTKKFFNLSQSKPMPELIKVYLSLEKIFKTYAEGREIFRKLYIPMLLQKIKKYEKNKQKRIKKWYPPFKLNVLKEWWHQFNSADKDKEKAELVKQLKELYQRFIDQENE